MAYQPSLFELDDFFHYDQKLTNISLNSTSGLQPLLKWPVGKEKELKHILPNIPSFKRYFEPFVGGGSVFMAITPENYLINDFSYELIFLYENIASSNEKFFYYAELIDRSWINALQFFCDNRSLVKNYIDYRENVITKEDLKKSLHEFCAMKKEEIFAIMGKELASLPSVIMKEMETNLFRKMVRMHELEIEKHLLPEI